MGFKKLSLGITVCHHSASLVMQNVDFWDRFLYHTVTFLIDTYILNIELFFKVFFFISDYLFYEGYKFLNLMFKKCLYAF